MVRLESLPIANILTVGRMALTPLFIFFLFQRQGDLALLVFVLAGLSDALDGYVARHLNQLSRFGAMADPLADKILILSAFAVLGFVQHRVSPWLAGLLIVRDALMFSWVLTLQARGYPVTACLRPTVIGKISTACLMTLLTFVLAMDWPLGVSPASGTWANVSMWLQWLSAVCVLAASASYLFTWPKPKTGQGGEGQGGKPS